MPVEAQVGRPRRRLQGLHPRSPAVTVRGRQGRRAGSLGTVHRHSWVQLVRRALGSESPPGKGKRKRKQQREEVAAANGGERKTNLSVAGVGGASAGHLFLEGTATRGRLFLGAESWNQLHTSFMQPVPKAQKRGKCCSSAHSILDLQTLRFHL